jgi:hypothetical protein
MGLLIYDISMQHSLFIRLKVPAALSWQGCGLKHIMDLRLASSAASGAVVAVAGWAVDANVFPAREGPIRRTCPVFPRPSRELIEL